MHSRHLVLRTFATLVLVVACLHSIEFASAAATAPTSLSFSATWACINGAPDLALTVSGLAQQTPVYLEGWVGARTIVQSQAPMGPGTTTALVPESAVGMFQVLTDSVAWIPSTNQTLSLPGSPWWDPPRPPTCGPVAGEYAGTQPTPDGHGYWQFANDGAVLSFGDAIDFGSESGDTLNKPVVGMASTPDGKGYWLVASDGGIFSYGDASFYGSTGSITLNKPVVGMASTPDGKGYWLVASDGGIFSYGDASFYGSIVGATVATYYANG